MKIHGVVLSLAVADMNRAHAFYCEVMGAENVRLDMGMVCIELPGITIFLAEPVNFSKYSSEAGRVPLLPVQGFDSFLSCAVASTQGIDGILASATAAGGVAFEPHVIPHITGRRQYVGTFTDPDGHLWQLVCNLAGPRGATG